MSNKWQRGNLNKSWVRGQKRPPGLKGRDIGLFYRDLQKTKNKQEPIVSLTIPPNVISQVILNIKAIESLAAKENIPLRRTESFIREQLSTSTTECKETSEPVLKTTKCATVDADASVPDEKTMQINTESSITTAEPSLKTIKCEKVGFSENIIQETSASSSAAGLESATFKVPSTQLPGTSVSSHNSIPKAGTSDNYIPINPTTSEAIESLPTRQLSLRGGGDYKYGYKDIITGTFEEKLNESLAKGVSINQKNQEFDDLSLAFHEEFKDMVARPGFRNMMRFRERLPTFKKSAELLNVISNNQIVVISGETGCGKSTQVPQIILDDAIRNNKGAYIHILVTQPRRIAASSLAARVAQERAEELGNSVGYAVRLEKTESRARGSIMYCTTGILLVDLEMNQSLSNYSHIILDEAHERDCHMDFSMCMLKQVLQKRKDLKLILMSATIDSERLSAYFDNCPTIHIEGLAYPVQPVFLEEILQRIKYQLPEDTRHPAHARKWKVKKMQSAQMEKDIMYRAEVGPWLESIKKSLDREVYVTLQDSRIEDMNIDLILELLFYICQGPPGAILVFLPGIGDITKLIKSMHGSGGFPSSRYEIYPLHSKLPTLDQRKIFEHPPEYIRKIIIATNIAETSITIDDIVYVVDCGKIKMTGLNVEDNISTLSTVFVSKANLLQRRGRAGRCQPGIAYHLITSYRAQTIDDRLLPELQRSNLLEPVLMIKKLRLGKAATALRLVPDVPAEITIEKAVTHLRQCGALDDEERLTPLGWHLARLPVHPAAGKLLLLGALFGCVDRAASVAAVWGFKDPFNIVIGKEREVDDSKRNFALGEPSDHVAVSEAIIQWEKCGQGQFAYERFLSHSTLHMLTEMKQQLYDTLGQMGFLTSKNVRSSWENRNADNLCVFKAIVAAALYPNIGIVKWNKTRNRRKHQRISVRTPEDGKVSLHPSSVMHCGQGAGVPLCDSPGANWLAYWLKQKSSDLFLHEVTLVYSLPLLFFGELVVSKVEDAPEDCYISVSTVKVQCTKETADVLFKLKALLDQVLASMVTASNERSTRHSQFDELVLKTVMDLITAEDERVEGLTDDSDAESDHGNWNNRHRSSFY